MFNQLKEFIVENLPQAIAFLFFVYIVFMLTRLALVKGQDLWEGIKGKNKMLDPEDFAILMWTILFPVLVLSDVFLDKHAGDNIWWSMNGILALILGYKGWGKNNKDVPSVPPNKDNKEDEVEKG